MIENRGFASMDPNKQREIASMGGRAAHQKGTAHEWTPEQAREAGRKGGRAAHQRRLSRDAPSTPERQDASLLAPPRVGGFMTQNAEPPDNGVQRCAHLVAERGQKHVEFPQHLDKPLRVVGLASVALGK